MASPSTADSFRLSSPLERYTHNLTELARQGVFSPLAGYDAAVERIFQILVRRNKDNPAVLDDNETRRVAIVIEAVRRLSESTSHEPLREKQIFMLDYEALLANIPNDAESCQKAVRQEYDALWQELARREDQPDEKWVNSFKRQLRQEEIHSKVCYARLWALFMTLTLQEEPPILFVDQVHRLAGGGPAHEAIDWANVLVPMLARSQFQIIGACTLEQYQHYIERDAAFQRRFQEVVISRVYPELGPTILASCRLS